MAAGHEVVLLPVGHREAVGHEGVVARLLKHLAVVRRGAVVGRQQGHRRGVGRVRGVVDSQQVRAVRSETGTVATATRQLGLLLGVHTGRQLLLLGRGVATGACRLGGVVAGTASGAGLTVLHEYRHCDTSRGAGRLDGGERDRGAEVS